MMGISQPYGCETPPEKRSDYTVHIIVPEILTRKDANEARINANDENTNNAKRELTRIMEMRIGVSSEMIPCTA